MPYSAVRSQDDPRGSIPGVPGWVGRQYYRHGLFCASYPKLVLILTALGVGWCCLPLFTLPIYTGDVKVFVQNIGNPSVSPQDGENAHQEHEYPAWLFENQTPVAYVQQIFMKAMVHPYKKDELIRTDAFRGPLATAFKLHLEDLVPFRDLDSGTSMDTECLRTDGLSSRYRSENVQQILPGYGCLIVSPAHLWRRDLSEFQMDPSIISTVFSYQNSVGDGHYSSLADIMFGIRQRETGLTKYPLRNRQRVVTYAVTVALKAHNPTFINALKTYLKKNYPIATGNSSQTSNYIYNLVFPSRSYFAELLPFFLMLSLLFIYVYFSSKKIHLVHSKVGIAFAAVITVLGSNMLSLALSGLTLNMSTKMCIIPYAVTFISLENVMVITRSVVTTQSHLDVKIRVAQGLCKEGWGITKNLLTEITILTFCYFTGVFDPSIREFCLLLVMGLLADFFLQMFFFTSVLALDMNRMELSDVVRKPAYRKKEVFQHPFSGPGLKKTSAIDLQTNVVAPQCSTLVREDEPKRVRFLNFWAKRRILQRLFMVGMIGWISTLVYQSSFLDSLYKDKPSWQINVNTTKEKVEHSDDITRIVKHPVNISAIINDKDSSQSKEKVLPEADLSQQTFAKLVHPDSDSWKRLPHTHWPMLFGLYNISLSGHFISILPPIHLSTVINSDGAKQLRHPQEELMAKEEEAVNSVEGLKNALELDDDSDIYESGFVGSDELPPFIPTTTGELILSIMLLLPSITFLLYLIVVFYRCVCSRNYAEWRTSWDGPEKPPADVYTQIVQESVPIVVEGHAMELENVVTNELGNLVVSMCLEGKINVWDAYSGENISTIERESQHDEEEESLQLEETGSKEMTLVKRKPRISTNFFANQRRKCNRVRTASLPSQDNDFISTDSSSPSYLTTSCPVWALDCSDRLLAVGCADGRVEIWDAHSGILKDTFCELSASGVTHVKIVSDNLIIARLSGNLEFFKLVPSNDENLEFPPSSSTWVPNSAPVRRYHIRSQSSGCSLDGLNFCVNNTIKINFAQSVRAHQQPVNCLETGGGRVLTGSLDHTIKVFRLEDCFNIFTFHGHCGPITAAFIDPSSPNCAGTGSQDGMVCMWDLLTGACLYSILAHDGAVLSLVHSPSYVISLGGDKKLCVWERFQGHLINSITMTGEYHCYDMAMLTHNLLVTSGSDTLIVWDARLPDPVKHVILGERSETHKIKILRHLGDTIACNYGNQLRFVHFPLLSDKKD